jgi:tRNA (adenine57-N1/adenine58-N1)-methyltransferase
VSILGKPIVSRPVVPYVGSTLILMDSRGVKHPVPSGGPLVKIAGLGTFDSVKLKEHVGQKVEIGGKPFVVLRASGRDLWETMGRGAQVLSPKDLAPILYEADVIPGATVIEAGAGSGALTVALVRAVGPSGHVVAYDLREESLSVASRNVERAEASGVVEFRLGDVRSGILERAVDVVVLDIPDPWSAVPSAWEALRPCGHLVTFSPNMEQVKETVSTIRGRPFVGVRTVELIEREMEVRDVGVRPSFAPLGHTGYLTFARKVLDTF